MLVVSFLRFLYKVPDLDVVARFGRFLQENIHILAIVDEFYSFQVVQLFWKHLKHCLSVIRISPLGFFFTVLPFFITCFLAAHPVAVAGRSEGYQATADYSTHTILCNSDKCGWNTYDLEGYERMRMVLCTGFGDNSHGDSRFQYELSM